MKRTFRKCLTLLIMLVCFVPTASAQADVAMDEFNNFNLVYIAPFEAPGKGSYGFMSEVFSTSGFGGAFGVQSNAGITENPSVTFNIGPTYGLPITKNLAVSIPVMLNVGAAIDHEDNWKFAFGGLVIPKLTFKKNRFSATLGVPLTYNNVVDKIVAAGMIGVGYEFNF